MQNLSFSQFLGYFRAVATIFLSILYGCSGPGQWTLSSISAGDIAFDSSRLTFVSAQAHPPITFEMMKFSDRIESYISLTRFRFTANSTRVTFTIGKQSFDDLVAVNEGAMRIRLSEEFTKRLIQALQEGEEVAILVDGFDERLNPAQFTDSFSKFIGDGGFQNFIKGPLP